MKLSDLERELFRLEAEYYQRKYLFLERSLQKYIKLGEKAISIECGPFGSNLQDSEYVSSGILVVRPFNLKQLTVEYDNLVYIPHKMITRNGLKLYNKGTLLFSRVGDIKIGVLNRDNATISPNIIAVAFKDDRLAKFLAIFFNTHFGFNQIQRQLKVSAQPTISTNIIEKLKIPFDDNLIKRISILFNDAQEKLQASRALYTSAENLLLETLGLKDWQPKVPRVNKSVRRFSFVESAGRFDAEYYQEKYEEVEKILKRQKVFRLGDIVDIQKSIEPGSEAYKTNGVPFIRVQDLSEKGIATPSVFLNEKYYNETLALKKDMILFTKDGSIGIAYKVDEDIKAITSGAILHLIIKDERFLSDYLYLYLNSIAVKMQAERDAGGSIIQHWKPSEIKQVLIPLIPIPTQVQIANDLAQSAALRKESAELLERAKHEVEREIECTDSTGIIKESN